MSLWRIAWRSIEQRGIASLLTALSMALGVMMVIAVLSISGVVSESFRSNASLGYNMIVGAKGGKLQLTLNTVYYLSQPVENIPYEFFLEFQPKAVRDRQLRNSLRFQAVEAGGLTSLASGLVQPDPVARAGFLWMPDVFERAAQASLEMGRDGKFSAYTGLAIPLCLGDFLGRFRMVGTTTDFLDGLTFGPESDRKYTFREGRNFQADNPEHRFFEAVLGAEVAREMKLRVGDTFSSTHGDPEGAGHGRPFTVVGILNPSGTPNDRAAFVNMEGFYLMEDHAKPVKHGESDPHGENEQHADNEQHAGDEQHGEEPAGHDAHGHAEPADLKSVRPILLEEREVTAILVRTSTPTVTAALKNQINEGPEAQAVLPVLEIYNLFESIVRPFQMLLLALTGLICLVSGVSILVSIYNSMSDRRHEIAVMRALGANRGTVMTIILLESILLSLAGGAAGWVSAHGLNAIASSRIEAQTGVTVHFWDLAPPIRDLDVWGLETIIGRASPEALIVPALIVLAIVVGLLPAIAAYRTDVSKSLQK